MHYGLYKGETRARTREHREATRTVPLAPATRTPAAGAQPQRARLGRTIARRGKTKSLISMHMHFSSNKKQEQKR